jgi:tRNA(Ile)-lysidine synthase
MLESFREHLQTSQLIPSHVVVIVGYSGGPDSTCLVHLLSSIGVDIIAAHLHHGQREEAASELKLCRAFAEQLGIPFISGFADVPQISSDLKISIEEAGRRARYDFLQDCANRIGADLIATAHTRDDHVETILLNLVRGTGLAGLAGIPESRQSIVRPLLPFTRAETRTYCEERGLWTHDDPCNTDNRHSRVRIRQNVFPELKLINPDLESAMARAASIVREETEFLDSMAAAALERSEIKLNGELSFLTAHCEIALSRELLGHLPNVLLKRALRLVAKALGSGLDFHQCQVLVDGLNERDRGAITTEGGDVAIEWDQEQILAKQIQMPAPFRFNLTVPGETISDELGWSIAATRSAAQGLRSVRAATEAILDEGGVKGTLFFRSAEPGLSIQPLGFSGRRKLADLMSEAGLTAAARRRLPVVCDMLGPIWVPGVCLEERVRVQPHTENALHLRLLSIDGSGGMDRNGMDTLSVR